MSMPWFKVYDEAQNDPKLESLSDAQFRVWFKLLCLANKQTERGAITGYDDLDLLAVEVARGDTDLLRQTLTRLVKLRIVSWCEEDCNTTTFVNFTKRQARKPSDEPEAVKKRVQSHRAGKRNAANTSNKEEKRGVTRYTQNETTPEEEEDIERDIDTSSLTSIETKEQTEVVNTHSAADAAERVFQGFFEEFWQLYPKNADGQKPQKPKAVEAARKVSIRDRPLVLKAVKHYAGCSAVQRGAVKYPQGFLNPTFWRDYLEAPTGGKKNGTSERDRAIKNGFKDAFGIGLDEAIQNGFGGTHENNAPDALYQLPRPGPQTG